MHIIQVVPHHVVLAIFGWDDLIVALIFIALSFILRPQPKKQKPAAAQQQDNPTAAAGRTIPVVFGTITIKDPNILWYGDKTTQQVKVK